VARRLGVEHGGLAQQLVVAEPADLDRGAARQRGQRLLAAQLVEAAAEPADAGDGLVAARDDQHARAVLQAGVDGDVEDRAPQGRGLVDGRGRVGGRVRGRGRLRRHRARHPGALLALPDRRLGLDAVDDLARAREGLAAVRRAGGDDDRRLAERHAAVAMVGGRAAQAVALDGLGDDRLDAGGGHLHVRVVVEERHVAGRAAERHHRARPRVAHARGHIVERQRGVEHGAAADRRHDRQLVAGRQHDGLVGVLTVDGQHERHARRQVLDLRQRVGHARAVGELELELISPGALLQPREQPHADLHTTEQYGAAGREARSRPAPPAAARRAP
jgi:hypothetical protein